MLYTIANERWTSGSPLPASETRAGLFRTRREAEAIAAGRRLLAVAVRYDAARGLVTPTTPADRDRPGGWSAPAIAGPSGGVTALAPIPASLVQLVGPVLLRVHAGHRGPGGPDLCRREVPTTSGTGARRRGHAVRDPSPGTGGGP
jgi:hypothetical protein